MKMNKSLETAKTPEKKKSTVVIKDVDIKDDLPPNFTDKFVLVVIRGQHISKLAQAYMVCDDQGYDFLTQINCLSRDVHLIFKRRKNVAKKKK